MIRDYVNMAANERTFLAWVRTGVTIVALGFVIERFNLFLLSLATAGDVHLTQLHRLASPAGRYGGIALVFAGVALIVVAMVRFLHIARLLEEETSHGPRATRVSFLALAALLLSVAAISVYLALG
jgi:putative membrane protein